MNFKLKLAANKKILLSLLIIFIVSCVNSTYAQKKIISSNKKISSNNQKKYSKLVWNDGKKKKELLLLHDMIADFSKNTLSNKSPMSKKYSGSKILHESSAVRLWQVNKTSLKNSLKNGKLPDSLKKNHSPVFKDSSGRKRALPGNVIIKMNKSLDEKEVKDWANARNLTIIKQLSSYNNSYLIKTSPGFISLKISNSLQNESGVISVSPDWWVQVFPR